MADQPYDPNNLQSVLRTLTRLAGETAETTRPIEATSQDPTRHSVPRLEQTESTGAKRSSTITTWPEGLRYVINTFCTNERAKSHLRRMIRNERAHYEAWLEGRRQLEAQQVTRGQKHKELQRVLESIGAEPSPNSTQQNQPAPWKEMQEYDLRGWSAAQELDGRQADQMRAMDIPFFTTDPSLIVGSESTTASSAAATTTDDSRPKVTREELQTLQERMVDLLKDVVSSSL
ncbi:Protein of unknown function DUF2458 [Penicillium argentinense]|uniref:Uncharacterized protein n=1 Tax=Penicillium argentinense TaxID=1131581 RepID=A0A9W9JUH6_9EURO|nr:Protein of unknown function DUF2458 [Penicillium argentinense]KAJ5082093.1 Protein of unknown function DUF2458 [Penicillium argentinense]